MPAQQLEPVYAGKPDLRDLHVRHVLLDEAERGLDALLTFAAYPFFAIWAT